MITREDVERITYRCFHCNKKINHNELRICVCCFSNADTNVVMDRYSSGFKKFVGFYPDCWKEIAGDEYCFSEEE